MSDTLHDTVGSLINYLSILCIGKDLKEYNIINSLFKNKVLSISEISTLGAKTIEQHGINLIIVDETIGSSAMKKLKEIGADLPIIYIKDSLRNKVINEQKNVYCLQRSTNITTLLYAICFINIKSKYKSEIYSIDVIKTILDINPTFIILLSDSLKLVHLNTYALNFLNYTSLQTFKEKSKGLFSFVSKIDKKDFNGKDEVAWIKPVLQNKLNHTISLKLTPKGKERLFVVSHTYIKPSKQHILSLTEVTEIVKEKDDIINELGLDKTTGLYNRTKFEKLFTKALHDKQMQKLDIPLSLIFFDIDNFKMVNDTYGHAAGDTILHELGNLILSSIRESDIATRWGGEEFIILVYADKDTAYIQANRLRQKIERSVFSQPKHITCSFGITEFKSNDDGNALINRSDKAMYRAKEDGKNQVKVI